MQKYFKRKLYRHGPAQAGFTLLNIMALGLIFFGSVVALRVVRSHALSNSQEIKSGLAGYCLDVYHNHNTPNTQIDSWSCNRSAAQTWATNTTTIMHAGLCLSVANNGTAASSPIVLDTCDEAAGQVWLRDKGGYENPNSGLCLAVPNDQTGEQLVAAACSNLLQPEEIWTSTVNDTANPDCSGTEGQRVSCYATQDWTTWQSGTPNHEALLNSYTDGAPYEEWCADFVSYVYKQAGHPFSLGETDGWDQNIADDIQYMGFIKHDANSYTPKPGDVAYFDYQGGHVEIVVSGGQQPTFIYGNSATIDPNTGNGEMEANTISSDGSYGQVIYYLSPNSP